MMLLATVPFAKKVWALPFFTVLAPSVRYHQQKGKRHKSIVDWARQMVLQLRRWIPDRKLVVVGDGAYAAIELAAFCSQMKQPVTLVTRLRLDAALYDPAPARVPGKSGPEQIVSWFVLRWQLEVTFHKVREYVGFETQRQWSDKAIERTSPMILALYSLIALFAHKLSREEPVSARSTIWYTKENPTFADAPALVRKELWPKTIFAASNKKADMVEIPVDLFDRMVDVLAYAA